MAKPQFQPLAAGGRVAPRADTHSSASSTPKTRSVKIRATINVPAQFQSLTPGEIGAAFIRSLEEANFEVVRLSAKNIEEE